MSRAGNGSVVRVALSSRAARLQVQVGRLPATAGTRPRNLRCPGIGAETPDPGQIGIPDFPNPGIPTKPGFPISRFPGPRPNRDSRFPKSRDPDHLLNRDSNPGKSRFFCSDQNRDCTLSAAGPAIAVPLRRPWAGKETHRPLNDSESAATAMGDVLRLVFVRT